MSIQELVNNIMNEYNKVHDKATGEFASGAGGGGDTVKADAFGKYASPAGSVGWRVENGKPIYTDEVGREHSGKDAMEASTVAVKKANSGSNADSDKINAHERAVEAMLPPAERAKIEAGRLAERNRAQTEMAKSETRENERSKQIMTPLMDEKKVDDAAKEFVSNLNIGKGKGKIDLDTDNGVLALERKRSEFMASQGIDKKHILVVKRNASVFDENEESLNTLSPHWQKLVNLAHGKDTNTNFTNSMNRGSSGLDDFLRKTPNKVNTILVMEKFNQHAMRKQLNSDEVTIYRGISGDQAKDLRASGNKTIGVHTLSSWTTDKSVADSWAYANKSGVTLETKVSISSIFGGAQTFNWMKKDKQNEVVLLSLGGTVKIK